MNKKKYVILGIVLFTISFFIGISYAIWQITLTQTEENSMTTGCFKINFTEENDIHLLESYPISDTEGLALQPYTFTIENICSSPASFQVNLEDITSATKKLSLEYLKVSFNQTTGNLLNTLESVTPTLKNATSSYKLTTGVLKPNTKKTYFLNLWIDENTPAIDETMEATFEGKVTIIATYQKDIPEVTIVSREEQDTIQVEVTTNKTEEEYTYVYQLDNREEITTGEPTHTFSNLEDGNYKVKVKVFFRNGILLEEKEETIFVAYERVYVSNTGNDTTGNGSIENPYASINPAYQKVKSGGSIILLNDIIATETANLNIENKEVNITSNGSGVYSIYRASNFKSQVLLLENSNIVTISNIVLNGNNIDANYALIEIHNSKMNLNDGAVVKNNKNISSSEGGGISSYKSELNINGARIENNKVQSNSNSQGGGMRIYNTILNFNNGIVINNEQVCSNCINGGGGGIFIAGNSNVYIRDGIISENRAASMGGGIGIYDLKSTSILEIHGGSIIKNVATIRGGGILANENCVVYLKGGIISNNTAPTGPNTYAYNGAQIVDER